MKIDLKIKSELKLKLKEVLASAKKKVLVSSAYELDSEEIEKLYQTIDGLRQSQIDYAVDKNLIAGYVIKVGSKVIDLSLKGKLQSLKNLIYETS